MPTPFFADLVRELCQEGGTGPLMPAGAVPGHRRFADAVPPDTAFHYAVAGIAHPDQWEVGEGRIDPLGRLVRESVSASSNGGARVDFSPGLKTVALTVGAAWFAAIDAIGGGLDADVAALGTAVAGKQPLSTTHGDAATGATGDLVTVRRGSGWVNIPLSSIAFRDAGGGYALGGRLGAQDGSAALPAIGFAADPDTGLSRPAADAIGLSTAGTERIRLTAAGHLGIGTATPGERLEVSGNILIGSGRSFLCVNENYGLGGRGGDGLELHCADGDRIRFGHRSGATFTQRWVIETNGVLRAAADNSLSLCTAAFRASVVFAATGTINTSDARAKAWRGAGTVAELRAARRIGAELGFYQWQDAIAEKGAGGARFHFGVRAQAVWDIMADEGLVDARGATGVPGATPYAFLCWDAWTDESTGATCDRFGIRPDQLALFLIAAQEQRIAALEAAA